MSEEEKAASIHYFIWSKGVIPPRSDMVVVKNTDKVYLLIEAIGRATGALGHVCLWKVSRCPTVCLRCVQ